MATNPKVKQAKRGKIAVVDLTISQSVPPRKKIKVEDANENKKGGIKEQDVATGKNSKGEPLAKLEGAETLLAGLRTSNIVLVQCGKTNECPGDWLLPRQLLRDHSKYFHDKLEDPKTTKLFFTRCGAPTFELFLQWMYTGQYDESSQLVETPARDKNEAKNRNLIPSNGSEGCQELMLWSIKAAMFAWDMGWFLQAPRFQNYAMCRLFEVFSRTSPRAIVGPEILEFMCMDAPVNRWKGRMIPCEFLEDVAVRNWGDTTLVDHENKAWSRIMGFSEGFRDKLTRGTGIPLNQRRQNPMLLSIYMVKEE